MSAVFKTDILGPFRKTLDQSKEPLKSIMLDAIAKTSKAPAPEDSVNSVLFELMAHLAPLLLKYSGPLLLLVISDLLNVQAENPEFSKAERASARNLHTGLARLFS
jgi:hypothetical protein